MRAIMWEETGYARNPQERRSEIGGLIAEAGQWVAFARGAFAGCEALQIAQTANMQLSRLSAKLGKPGVQLATRHRRRLQEPHNEQDICRSRAPDPGARDHQLCHSRKRGPDLPVSTQPE